MNADRTGSMTSAAKRRALITTGITIIAVVFAIGWIGSCIEENNAETARWKKANPAAYKAGDVVRSKLHDTKLLVDAVQLMNRHWRYNCKYVKDYGAGFVRETWDYFWEREIAGLWSETEVDDHGRGKAGVDR